eukprot:Gregarina_sp_Poly_1__6802@NODE_3678_length_933_cov_3_705543_g2348_i0_p1_GENE_NODE_3678_length_933_cov_3_705543_g2348_i0NODE_3678_length_933_cov_3_705543_g2348_i0_p1_ORF_typecomplete_len154_score7_84_NODE_3678_length_933_cov_3_705543_g2348_i0340801
MHSSHWADELSLSGTQGKLLKLIRRRAGWICPLNFDSTDLVLPVYVGPHDQDMQRDQIVPILIQVKNRGLQTSAQRLFSTLNTSDLLKPFKLTEREDGLNIFWLIDKACDRWSIQLLESSTQSVVTRSSKRAQQTQWTVMNSPLELPTHFGRI